MRGAEVRGVDGVGADSSACNAVAGSCAACRLLGTIIRGPLGGSLTCKDTAMQSGQTS